jgi:hypothetical protein
MLRNDEHLDESNPMLNAALEYARLGYPVFPCIPMDKRPITPNGRNNCTLDESTIRDWWTRWPNANIGLATDGLLVVDIDGNDNPWPVEEHRKCDLIDAPTSVTPRGGRHHVFRAPEGRTYKSTASKLAEKVDTRGNGGYIVVAPSKLANGQYQWIDGLELDIPQNKLPTPPAWLDTLFGNSTNKALHKVGDANPIPDHQRNATLASLAGTMRRVGMSQREMEAALLVVNADRCIPPITEGEVKGIARKIARYEPDQATTALVEGHFQQMMMPESSWNPFPVDILPKCLGQFIETVSNSMMIDPSLVALPALSALASAIGNSRRIKLKNGWTEPSIIWTTVIAESGSTKSPPFEAVMQPLREWQDCDKGRTLTANATIEAIAKVLSENPRGIILARNELSGWFASFGEYKLGPFGDVSTWLELNEGKSIVNDRVANGTLKIARSNVSVSGTIQPSILATVLKPEFRQNGLLARFLLAAPHEKEKVWTEHDIPDSASQEWRDLIWSLLAIADEKELLLGQDQEAKKMFIVFYNHYNKQRKDLPVEASDMRAAYPKLIAYAARIALVVQMVRYVGEGGRADIIEAESMAAAIKLVEWFKNETMRVYGLLAGAKKQAQEESLLDFIRRQGGKASARDVQRNYRPCRNQKAEEIEQALMELAKDGRLLISQEGKSTVFTIQVSTVSTVDGSLKNQGKMNESSTVDSVDNIAM